MCGRKFVQSTVMKQPAGSARNVIHTSTKTIMRALKVIKPGTKNNMLVGHWSL